LNSFLFSGLTCERNDAVNTNCPIVLLNPAKKALKGKLVTRMQYINCSTPENMMNSRNESINFRRSVVCSLYAIHNEWNAPIVVGDDLADGVGFGPAIAATWTSRSM